MATIGYLHRWQVATTVGVIGLAVVATALGLFLPGFYRDPVPLRLQAYGQDVVTLVVVLPVLAVGLRAATRGSMTGYFVWLGAMGYVVYTYAVFAVVAEFNRFFLGYVALFGLSLFSFVSGLLAVDARAVKRRLEPDLPVRPLAAYFAATAALVAGLWLSEVVPATLTGSKPASIESVGLPANVVHVLDLGVLVPAMFLTAGWLWRRRPWGYVLPGVLIVKVVSIGLAVLGMIGWTHLEGRPVEPVEVGVFGALTLLGLVFGLVYFRSITPVDTTVEAWTADIGDD